MEFEIVPLPFGFMSASLYAGSLPDEDLAMRWNDIYLNASAMALGRRESTAVAVADGRYDAGHCEDQGYQSVCVADDGPAMDMAVQAARGALSRSDVISADVRLVIHASCGPQGPEGIAPASYIQGQTIKTSACAIEIMQTCNGGMAALEIASAYLAAAPPGSSALVTTSDKWLDRYQSDRGYLVGDGGTALVLSRGRGVARLLSTVITGEGRFSDLPDHSRNDPDYQAYPEKERRRLIRMLLAMSVTQQETIRRALEDAGLESGEISRWVFANIGHFSGDQLFRQEFGIEEARTTWDWGRTVGHLGTGDQVAGFTYLVETGAVRPGDRLALCGSGGDQLALGGGGFSYGCAIVEIVDEVNW